MSGIEIFIWAMLGLLVVWQPYLGIIIIGAGLSLEDLFPSTGDLGTILPILGAITLAGFLLQNLTPNQKILLQFRNVHILGFLFIAWCFITNPQAAWNGPARNWVLTFLQLWILMVLTHHLLDKPKKQQTFLWVFSMAAMISALVAMRQGYLGGAFTVKEARGLADGSNAAARYFVVSFVSLNYLRANETGRLLRLLSFVGIVVTFIGVFITISRTGMMLLFGAFALMFLLQAKVKFRRQIIALFIISWVVLWFMSDSITNELAQILPSISQGSDTVGLRYTLWKAGWRMFIEQPLLGVGIGMFPYQLPYYAADLLPAYHLDIVAHNMYIQILAETGIVGLGLFLSLLVVAVGNFILPVDLKDEKMRALRNTWFIIIVVMLAGGMTMSNYADKLIWMTMGIGPVFRYGLLASGQNQSEATAENSYSTTEAHQARLF